MEEHKKRGAKKRKIKTLKRKEKRGDIIFRNCWSCQDLHKLKQVQQHVTRKKNKNATNWVLGFHDEKCRRKGGWKTQSTQSMKNNNFSEDKDKSSKA